MDRIKSLTKALSASPYVPGILNKRSYISFRHKEPRKLSWQWLAKEKPEIVACKDLCFPKKCPKPSFFPRWKKHYIPKDKKSCPDKTRKMTWGEYFSYLFPDPVAKPPLVTCRKLQAERRRACTDPRQYPGYCLNENCCPPLKEWYGQAVVYQVPSPFPEMKPAPVVHPCVAPAKRMESDVCPRRLRLDMNEFAYKKPYNPICGSDTVEGVPQQLKCAGPCYDNRDKLDRQPICRFFSDYKEYQPPQSSDSQLPELPQKVFKASEAPEKPKAKEINVEHKKTICDRQSFLKPYKGVETYEGMGTCKRKMHTFARSFPSRTLVQHVSKMNYSTIDRPKVACTIGPTEWESNIRGAPTSQSAFRVWDNPTVIRIPSYSSDVKTYGPNDFASSNSYKASEIDPELVKLAEETNKKCKYAPQSKTEGRNASLLEKLIAKTNERYTNKTDDDCKKAQMTCPKCEKVPLKNKFSLCKSSSFSGRSKANLSTSAFNEASKKGPKKEDNKICGGCPGIREMAEQLANPRPKPAINCRARAAGKCKTFPKEGQEIPDNPYTRNRAKSLSICNKPRPPVCKKERPYKMPCEESKRKYHSTTFLAAQANFTPLAEIMKDFWSQKEKKSHSLGIENSWDSHTADSYFRTDGQDSVIGKPKHSAQNSKKTSTKNIRTLSNVEDFDSSSDETFHTKINENIQEKAKVNSVMNKLETASQSKASSESVIKEARPVNIWDKGQSEILEESEPKETDEDSTPPKRGYMPFQRTQSTDNSSKPTKFSVLFKSSSSEAESKARIGVGHASRGQARDFFNPMEE